MNKKTTTDDGNIASCSGKSDKEPADSVDEIIASLSSLIDSGAEAKHKEADIQPVVMLRKLDSDIIAAYTKGLTGMEGKQGQNMTSKKVTNLDPKKKKHWYDDDASLSDFSVSDIEMDVEVEGWSSETEEKCVSEASKTVTDNKPGTHSLSKKFKASSSSSSKKNNRSGSLDTSRARRKKSSSQTKHSNSETSRHTSTDSSATNKRSRSASSADVLETIPKKMKEIEETIMSTKKTETNTGETLLKAGLKVKLSLWPILLSDLSNEQFRKFINLALDVAVDFTTASNFKTRHGTVHMYFSNTSDVFYAMQRLIQLTDLGNGGHLFLRFSCFPVKKRKVKEKEGSVCRCHLYGSVFLDYNGKRVEKLRSLISLLDKKTQNSKPKIAKVCNIPRRMTNEMVSLLFPFANAVTLTGTETDSQGFNHSLADVEYASEELMEAALTCFSNYCFQPLGKGIALKPTIQNFVPPSLTQAEQNSVVPSSLNPLKNNPNQSNASPANPRQRSNASPANPRQRSNASPANRRQKSNASPANPRQRSIAHHQSNPANKNPRKRPLSQARTSDQMGKKPKGGLLKTPPPEALRQAVLAQGYNPNHPYIRNILELQDQLSKLQQEQQWAIQKGKREMLEIREREMTERAVMERKRREREEIEMERRKREKAVMERERRETVRKEIIKRREQEMRERAVIQREAMAIERERRERAMREREGIENEKREWELRERANREQREREARDQEANQRRRELQEKMDRESNKRRKEREAIERREREVREMREQEANEKKGWENQFRGGILKRGNHSRDERPQHLDMGRPGGGGLPVQSMSGSRMEGVSLSAQEVGRSPRSRSANSKGEGLASAFAAAAERAFLQREQTTVGRFAEFNKAIKELHGDHSGQRSFQRDQLHGFVDDRSEQNKIKSVSQAPASGLGLLGDRPGALKEPAIRSPYLQPRGKGGQQSIRSASVEDGALSERKKGASGRRGRASRFGPPVERGVHGPEQGHRDLSAERRQRGVFDQPRGPAEEQHSWDEAGGEDIYHHTSRPAPRFGQSQEGGEHFEEATSWWEQTQAEEPFYGEEQEWYGEEDQSYEQHQQYPWPSEHHGVEARQRQPPSQRGNRNGRQAQIQGEGRPSAQPGGMGYNAEGNYGQEEPYGEEGYFEDYAGEEQHKFQEQPWPAVQSTGQPRGGGFGRGDGPRRGASFGKGIGQVANRGRGHQAEKRGKGPSPIGRGQVAGQLGQPEQARGQWPTWEREPSENSGRGQQFGQKIREPANGGRGLLSLPPGAQPIAGLGLGRERERGGGLVYGSGSSGFSSGVAGGRGGVAGGHGHVAGSRGGVAGGRGGVAGGRGGFAGGQGNGVAGRGGVAGDRGGGRGGRGDKGGQRGGRRGGRQDGDKANRQNNLRTKFQGAGKPDVFF